MDIFPSYNKYSSLFFAVMCSILISSPCTQGEETTDSNQINVISALIRYSYTDPNTGEFVQSQGELGRYATTSPVHPVSGVVVHVKGEDGENHGCSAPVNVPANKDWIALIVRGTCKFQDKILNAAMFSNASAVVIYNHLDEENLITMQHNIDHVVSVFIGKHDGEKIATLADSGVPVQLDISIGQITMYEIVQSTGFKPHTLLIISLSLVLLLITGLVILLICGIRKARFNKKKNSRKNVFTLHKPGQVHESLLTELETMEHSRSPHPSGSSQGYTGLTPI